MAKDPIRGMNVEAKGARYHIDRGHETIYFCSERFKKTYDRNAGMKTDAKKKGFFTRFLEKLAKDNNRTFGGTPPKCH